MAWYGVITNAGINALAQSVSQEVVLDIDAVKLGTGTYTEEQMYTATAVNNYCGNGEIGMKRNVSQGVQIIANIYALQSSQTVKQVGIFGTINGASVMVAIYQNDEGVEVPSTAQFKDFTYSLTAIWDIDNTENLTITVSETACVPYSVYNAQCDEYDAAIAGKVDKVSGKGLSQENFTTAEKTKLAGISDAANRYILPTATENTLGGVKVGENLTIDANGVLSATGGYGTPDYMGFYIGDGVGASSPYKRKISLPFSPKRVVIFNMKFKTQLGQSYSYIVTFGYGENYIHSGCGSIYVTQTSEAQLNAYFQRGHGGAAVTEGGFYVSNSSGNVYEVNYSGYPYMFFAWKNDPMNP